MRAAHGEARLRVVELQAQLVPVMKELYKPLKKAVARIQAPPTRILPPRAFQAEPSWLN